MEQDQSKVLLVEGAGDEGVIKEILNAWNVPCPCIKACGSDAQVFQALKLYLSNPGQYKTIGVIVDADINPGGRLQRFAQVLNVSPEHVVHRLTKIFSSMRSDKDQFPISHPVKFWMRIILSSLKG